MFSWFVPFPRAARTAVAYALVVLFASLAGCADTDTSSGGICKCLPAEFTATSTTGADFSVSGKSCGGTCRTPGTKGCAEFVVTAPANTTCTVSATGAAVGADGATEEVAFALHGCCGTFMPSPREWTVP